MEKLIYLFDSTVSAVNIDRYAQLIREKQVRREVIALGNEIVTLAQNSPPSAGDVTPLLEAIEEKVHQLTQSHHRSGLSTEEHQYQQLIERIKQIETSTDDPGQKHYQKLNLAKQQKLSLKAIEAIYCKSLVSSPNEKPLNLAQMREKYGKSSNDWLVQGLIPKGSLSLLHANGGTGKTRLVYELAYRIATGTAWNEEFNVTADHRKVLIVQTDEPPGDCLRTIESRGFAEQHGLLLKTNWNFDHIASLRHEIETNGIEFLVIDSMTAASIGSTFTENETEYAKPVLELRNLASDLGVGIVLIHHSNSQGKSRGTKAIYRTHLGSFLTNINIT